jgi:hypothetical protein
MIRKVIYLLIFSPAILLAQKTDSTLHTSSTTHYFFENQFGTDTLYTIDNSLKGFQDYISHNTIGNSGLPIHDQSCSLNTFPGFNYRKNNYRDYFYDPHTLKFWNTHVPYSDLLYITGSKKEQLFKMTFSYNVKDNWNLTADFSRIRSEGFYRSQKTNDNAIALSSNFQSRNNRYWFLTSLMYNKAEHDENGGAAADSLFDVGGGATQNTFDVNLNEAASTTLHRSFFLKQFFNLGPASADTTKLKRIIPSSQFSLSTYLGDRLMKYEDADPLSGFYSNVYYDSIATYDSTYQMELSNTLAWKRLDNKKHRGIADMLGLSVNAGQQFIHIRQREIDTSFSNISGGVQFYNTYSNNRIWWCASGQYYLSGYNQNDLAADISIKKGFGDSLNAISVKAGIHQHQPDFIYQRYSSNHFKWENNFVPIQNQFASLLLEMPKYDLAFSASFSAITNPVYFDNFAIARQYRGTIPVISTSLKKDLSLFNWHLDNLVTYQFVPDSTIIRLPELQLQHSLYYENDIFKKAMHVQVGAELHFTSAYYADAYMPATTQFYLQSEKKYGAYPFFDFFINVRVKTVRVFIKVDHLNAGMAGSNYMQTPHYPMPGRAFKFGVSWRFYD